MLFGNFFDLKLLCTFFMVIYALSPERSMWGRIVSLSMIGVAWLVPYGWILGFIWGALCWSHSRAKNV